MVYFSIIMVVYFSITIYNYFKFLGALAQYIEYIKEGFSFLSSIKEYCNTFSAKKVSIDNRLKIVGKIDLKVDGRKRFK